MIRVLLVFLFFISLNASELAKIHINKNHSIITFIDSLAGEFYVSEIPKEVYYDKVGKRFDEKLINKIVALQKKISKSRIYGHKKTRNLLEAFYLDSIIYPDLKSFERHMLKYKTSFGKENMKKYFKLFAKMQIIYEKIIWDKNVKKLEYKKFRLEKLIKKYNYDQLIIDLAKFYGLNKKQIHGMNIALYAIPRKSNMRAYSIKDIETIGIQTTGTRNLRWLMSATILHEISHTFYGKSTLIRDGFRDIKNKKRRTLINEVFATAAGAGWGFSKLDNKKHTLYNWYNNPKYDRLAKKIYPKIKSYLDSGRVIDREFINYIKRVVK
jgi:uncharacterized protein (UPF0335 family)